MRGILRATLVFWIIGAAGARADLSAATTFFESLSASADAAVFPVSGRGLDDVESAFGPRIQTSTSLYDWHRGIDVDGTLNSDAVVAPLDGYFYDYRFTAAGGHIVILEHRFADFLGGATPSISYGGKTLTKFYTWHLHLFDDGTPGNNAGTDDITSAFTVGQSIARGTPIGVLGDSGSAAAGGDGYAPHLHFELRLGTNSSLEFQLANPGTTQWGFDPHVNPMLLFAPPPVGANGYQPSLTVVEPFSLGQAARFRFASGTDDSPLLNRWEVRLVNVNDDSVVKSHLLDYNERLGYDASSTAALDSRDQDAPFVDPLAFGDSATDFQTDLVVPADWTAGYAPGAYRLEVTATDLFGNSTSVAAVPEPAAGALLVLAILVGALSRRGRRITAATARPAAPGAACPSRA